MASQIIGEKALTKKLNRLAKDSERNKMVRPALREAAAVIRKKARGNVAKETGLLRESIQIKAKTTRGVPYAIVGPQTKKYRRVVWRADANFGEGGWVMSDPSKYAHFVEFGTSPKGNHPGTPPQPFLRPAYDSTNSRSIIVRRIQSELRKQAQGRVGKTVTSRAAVSALRKVGR